MASPVFHGLAGAGLAYLMAGNPRQSVLRSIRDRIPLFIGAAALACLPDIDYLPGILTGDLNAYHQQGTHSIAWTLLASAVIWLLIRWQRPARATARLFLFIFILIASHLAIDMITEDHRPPYGIPLFAPISNTPYISPVPLLPAWQKSSLADLATPANLRPLAIELASGTLLFSALLLTTRSLPIRASRLFR